MKGNFLFSVCTVVIYVLHVSCYLAQNERIFDCKFDKAATDSYGCAGFLIYKSLKDDANSILVVQASAKEVQVNRCYDLEVGNYLFNQLKIEIYVDKYLEGRIKKSYCGDISIANYESPVTFHAVSGSVRFIVEEEKGSYFVTCKLNKIKLINASNNLSITIDSDHFYKTKLLDWGG